MSFLAGMAGLSWRPVAARHADGEPGVVRAAWTWAERCTRRLLARPASGRLRVAETVGLGEKRFVSVIEVDGERLLIGGSASSVVLLTRLKSSAEMQSGDRTVGESFGEVIEHAAMVSAGLSRVQQAGTDDEVRS